MRAHICCGTPTRWGRRVFCCPVCKGRHRGIVRLVFGGYGLDTVCGGCGTWFYDFVGRKPGKQEGECNRDLVRKQWPRAATPKQYRRIVNKELKGTMGGGK